MRTDADRTAAALESLWLAMADAAGPRVWVRSEPGIVAMVTGLDLASMNGVWALQEDADPDVVRSLLAEVSEAGLPFCLQARGALRDALAGTAEAAGLQPYPDIPLMALQDPTAVAAAASLDGLTIRRLGDDEQDVHVRVAAQGFEAPEQLFADMMALLGGTPGLATYVGEVDGRPVTTAMAVPSSEASAGVFNVATPPEYRHHGYGAAVTAYAAQDAMAAGAAWAWLQSSADGYHVYERLGFRTVDSLPFWVSG